ncbi:hypothetical protein [Brevundimonas sp. SL130]|uniref:hypothetical protein n=1 Tax=Brevundimonas sp. SL130 TaxID=2995143 RepID=UPI00226CC7C9|nr:hypothetical protein [Brevundimonas sp. SL130]WAC59455.1 hypothetical protein OU998_14740 [Brevundimonas sp. SL130]
MAASLLSGDRLASLLRITGTERDAFEVHQQMMAVAAALMPVSGLIEIVLRNAICDRLRQMFGAPDWLNNPPAPFSWRGEEASSLVRATRQGQRAEYAKKSNAEKKALDAIAYPNGVPHNLSHEHRAKRRQQAIRINAGQQIAQLTIHFWKRLFSSDYEASLWDRSLKRMFPNKQLTRAEVAAQLEVIYQARNRIAHHEPLYGPRLDKTLEAIDFIAENFGEKRRNTDAILCKMMKVQRASLQQEADRLAAMLAAFSVTTTTP